MTKKYALILIHGDSRNVEGIIRHIENALYNKKLDYCLSFRGPISEVNEVKNEVTNAMMKIWKKNEGGIKTEIKGVEQ